MKPSELLFLAGLSVFAGVTLIGSMDMPFSSGQTFGPGFLPLIMGLSVITICAMIGLRGFLRAGPASNATEVTGNIAPVLFAIALIAAAIAGASFGSLLLPLGVCIMVVTGYLLNRGWVVALVSTLITLVAIYAIFGIWLQIPIS